MDWDTLSLVKHKPLQKNPHFGVIEGKVKQKPMCGIRTYGSLNPLECGIPTARQVPGVSLPIEAYVNPWLIQMLGTDLKNKEIINEHDKDIGYLSLKVAQMEKEIQELKDQLKINRDIDDIWRVNEENIQKIEKLFNLPSSSSEPIANTFTKMKGLLKQYSEDGVSSVDLLYAMRNHDGS